MALVYWTATVMAVVMQTTSVGATPYRRLQPPSDYQQLPEILDKRVHDGNPCPDFEKPFPCKSTSTCIPMGYVCDSNVDCEDGYDENPELCAAANRPPIEDIMNFLHAERRWIIDNLFAGRNMADIAHGLVVSQTLEDFRQRLSMTEDEIAPLKQAVRAIETGNSRAMASLGMPPHAWNEVSFIFSKLINSGFTK